MNMKRYTFVKLELRIPDCKPLKYGWRLKCSTVEEVIEHTEKYMGLEIKRGLESIFHKDPNQHNYTIWGSAIDALASIKNSNILVESTKLEEKILFNKLKSLEKKKYLYLSDRGSYFIDSQHLVEVDRMVMKEMVYPSYTKEDIRISQWPNGNHWYAEIGNLPVEDDQGNNKWDKKKEAQYWANKFLKELK